MLADDVAPGVAALPDQVDAVEQLVAALVHVQSAIDFELDGMQARSRVAVVLGDEAAGIGLVASDRIAKRAHGFLDHVGKQACATGAVAVADHHVRPPRLVARHPDRRHRMAIHHDHGSKRLMRLVDQPPQRELQPISPEAR